MEVGGNGPEWLCQKERILGVNLEKIGPRATFCGIVRAAKSHYDPLNKDYISH